MSSASRKARWSIQSRAGRSGSAVGVAGDHRAGRAVEPDPGDLVGPDLAAGASAGRTAAPAADHHWLGVLLGPGGPGVGRLDRRDPEGDRPALQVDQRGAEALGPDVEAEHDR